MNRTIFISHTNDDKPSITPILVRLLEEIPEINLWIDRPEELPITDVFKRYSGRISGIPLGEDWRQCIDTSDARIPLVLAFWSTNCVDQKKCASQKECANQKKCADQKECILEREKIELKIEIERASKHGKLIPAQLDESAEFHLKSIQPICLNNEEIFDAKFDRIVQEIRERLAIVPANILDELSYEKCPYLIDRTLQIDRIIEARSNNTHLSSHFVLPYQSSDAIGDFFWRLCSIECPAIKQPPRSRAKVKWKNFHVPAPVNSPADLENRLRCSEIANELDRLADDGTPTCFTAQLNLGKCSDKAAAEFAIIWTDYIESELDKIVKKNKGQTNINVMSVLGICQSTSLVKMILMKLGFGGQFSLTGKLGLVKGNVYELPPMGKIDKEDLTNWKLIPEITDQFKINGKDIEKMYGQLLDTLGKKRGKCDLEDLSKQYTESWYEC